MTFNCGILRGIVLLHEADRQTVSLVLLHFPQVGLESSGEGRQRARSLHSSHLDWHSSDWQLVSVTDTVAAAAAHWQPDSVAAWPARVRPERHNRQGKTEGRGLRPQPGAIGQRHREARRSGAGLL